MSQAVTLGPIEYTDAGAVTTRRRWPWANVSLAGLLIVYTAFLLRFFAPAICEPDDNGYFAQGTLLLRTGHTWFTPRWCLSSWPGQQCAR